jgi:hypothetical protein
MFAVCVFSLLLLVSNLFAQETTGGLQGTVKDPSGAVVSKSTVELTGSSLVGSKKLETDSSGYYRFANLPPGLYTVTVKAAGFSELKREGITIEVGHLPTLDLTLSVGAAGTVVEVTGEAPVIDVTTNTNQTNLTSEALNDTPHGYSFQSVIQYAPMARNEPLAGGSAGMTGNAGGSLPGSAGNGLSVGFQIGGAADSESSYLVEGQDTENVSGGASSANVPFQFIQEVQVKTSGIEAEHGGALGGVVNVVMKKGSNAYHGSLFMSYESDATDGSPTQQLRYDPIPTSLTNGESDAQIYSPKKDHFRIAQPGFTVGGPLAKDRVWFFIGLAPQYNSTARTVNFGPSICTTFAGLFCPNSTLGNQIFTNDSQQYFGTARIDATLTNKIRVFGSLLYQYQRATGVSLPGRDPINAEGSFLNTSILSPLTQYSHGLGFSSPNSNYNFGADITLTPKIVSTTRFGYFFSNYHDFGWPTSSPSVQWASSGIGAVDNLGNALPVNLQQPLFNSTAPFDQAYTLFNASKHYQFDEDVAFFKSGWGGTHNIKVGYQLNRLSNVIHQDGNVPFVNLSVGSSQTYFNSTTTGGANCGTLTAAYGHCAGQFGFAVISDFATILPEPAVDWNHALFAQDAWTVGHGLTLNLGIRVEKESLPVPPGVIPNGFESPKSINFSWSDKVEPRLGFAWGSRNGKMKIFGSYGVVNDVMKLLLAQSSWGAQGFDNCAYALGPDGTSAGFNAAELDAVFINNRSCVTAAPTVGANFASGAPPASFVDTKTGVSLIENVDFRPWEPIAPGVKPYRQHEFVAGVDYQLAKDWAFEARYDRRRLDHAIEDASLADPTNFEMYTVVNPGQGVNKTIDGYATFLKSLGDVFGVSTAPGSPAFAFDANPANPFGTCPTCPNNPVAIRNYDGMEIRLTKTSSHGWAGMFSYTWSSAWGNYTGLTTTDQIDGGITGRNSPDTTRAFDEPFYYFNTAGKSNDGPLPTDRPNTLKGNVYYSMPWKGKTMTTTLGLFQVAYEGSPMSSYADLGLAGGSPVEATYIFGRGKWVNASEDATGLVTLGNAFNRRTPWYTQTDFNFSHAMKVNKNNEHQVLAFNATFTNLLNQHSPVSYWGGFNSNYSPSDLFPDQVFTGAAFYQTVETGYSTSAQIASQLAGTCQFCQIFGVPLPLNLNSRYGEPNVWQLSRNIRLGVSFSF